MRNKYYITTPIYYVNDVPHIGHSCTTLVADILARANKQTGKNVFFLTGTDEHGQKIFQSAQKSGLSTIKFCNNISKRFKKTWKDLNISNDYFIRTTNEKHKKVVIKILNKLYKKGDIYKKKYNGLYCIGCEKFLTETDLINNHCPLHPPEQTVHQEEENWFFKISKYIPQIFELVKNDKTNYVFPEKKRKEVLAKLKEIDRDISISRANVSWGVPVPWDKKQTVYVWIDALINYYSATQFVKNKANFWPADIHLIGKEISLFHTIIWPALLLACGLEIPKKVLIHDFYIIRDRKMSKSLGNMITPQELISLFAQDGTRYLIASSFPIGKDSDISIEKFKEKYNADLANGLGNLISRTASLAEKNNFIIDVNKKYTIEKKILRYLEKADTPQALFEIFHGEKNSVTYANKFINNNEVWKLNKKQAVKFLAKTVEIIGQIACNLKPFIPNTSKKIQEIFAKGKKIHSLKQPLFPKI